VNKRILIACLVVSVGFNVALLVAQRAAVGTAHADVTPASEELSMYMSQIQRHAHKLGLSVQAKNKPLAEFYLTELGETFEIVQKKFPQYEGYQIAALSKAMIDPAKPALAKALGASDWPGATTAYGQYLTACNNCHVAVKHEFVKVVAPTGNPFNQTFSTK
jgi:hypothetical protein